MTQPACQDERRRSEVRRNRDLFGLDYLEVSADQKALVLTLLGKLPEVDLKPENFRIEGGRRIQGIRVEQAFTRRYNDPEIDDTVELLLNRAGDFSTYTLRVVERVTDGDGIHRVRPHSNFDPRYSSLEFSFKVDCGTELDCCVDSTCPPEKTAEPVINYLAKDYASFRQLMLDRLSVIMPDWKDRYAPDLVVTLLEILAYTCDYLSYYQDAVAMEAYLGTARQRISVRRHARLVDYQLHEGTNARTFLVLSVQADLGLEAGAVQFLSALGDRYPVELTKDHVRALPESDYEVFEPMVSAKLYPGHDEIPFYTWGNAECCLTRGAMSATLLDQWVDGSDRAERKLKLQRGDILVFEEVLGPRTGNPADSDPLHRQAVRLTQVLPGVDPLNGVPIVEIEWSYEDRLLFALCLSAIGPAPECVLLQDVSVARANVVLVDHGRTLEEDLPAVPIEPTIAKCKGEGVPSNIERLPGKYRPRLSSPNIVYTGPLRPSMAASLLLEQDPHAASPAVLLQPGPWTPQPDLIDSAPEALNMAVESDNERVAWLRFRAGTLAGGSVLRAKYRVGGGKEGNLGAGSIQHVLWPSNVSGAITAIRNPLAAVGGKDPQPIAEAKLFAPRAFIRNLERAVTAEDYAALAEREFASEVQRAVAALAWNGSWYEVLLAIDARHRDQAGSELLERIAARLERYRRIGHDLRVQAAVRVPIDLRIDICIKSAYLRAHVLRDLQNMFGAGVLPDGGMALFHPDNLTFGQGLYLSRLVSAAQSVAGVLSVRVTRFERLFEGPHGEIESGVLRLGPLEIAQCESDPSFPEHGAVQFVVGGGQ